MQAGEVQVRPAIEHVYRYTVRSPRVLANWLAAYPFSLAIIFILSGLSPPHRFHLDPFSAVGGLAVMCIGAVLSTRATALTVTPEGVGYRRSSRYTWVLWQDIEAIRPWSRGYYGWATGEGLVIRSAALSPPGSSRRRTFARHFIPLAYFAPHWRDGPLGEDIRQYAPWLLNRAASG